MFKPTHSILSLRRLPLFATIALLQAGLSQRASAFELVQKVNALSIQGGTDSFAATNRLGSALTSTFLAQFNPSLTTGIGNGTLAILLEMPGLTNFDGSSQSSFNLGIIDSQPLIPSGNPATYSATSDLDWWYAPLQNALYPNGIPTNQLSASFAAGVMHAGPGQFSLLPNLFNALGGRNDFSTVVIQATVSVMQRAPSESNNGYPPGHVAAENIPPGFETFLSMTGGKLRGNVSAASLAATPIPASLAGNDGYTAANTWLDMIVGGLTEFNGVIVLVNPTQPDQSDPAAPVVGAGPPYKFIMTGTSITGAKDKNGNVISLSDALNAAAYSFYFTFTTSRVIAPAPALLSITNTPDGVVVSWPAGVASWTLQTSDSLTDNWSNYLGTIVNTSVTNPPSAGNLFYRLQQ